MKIDFSNKVKFIPTWNGNDSQPKDEQIVVTMTPLKSDDLIVLLDALGDKMKAEAGTGLSGRDIAKLIAAVSPIVQSNVILEGLQDNEGAVDSKRMVEYPRYMMLTSEILFKLANISSPSEAAEKNSGAQPV